MSDLEMIYGKTTLGNVSGELKSEIGNIVRCLALKKWLTKQYPCGRLYYVSLLERLTKQKEEK